ncbi:DNA-binding protein [Rossellomorea marisflavi]|uniref:DNA-binding protein n=1 Tax=Rossellomorea marisflavi TaxID=189381 RepID=A0A5D4RV87_9BACI|nr:DNA-binding protein [Rossellomorea marisflavi]
MNREELPEVLTPKHVQEILEIGRKRTSEMMENPPFHIAKVGKLY